MYMYVCVAMCMNVGAYGGQWHWVPLQLELRVCESANMGAGFQTQAFGKSGICS